MEAHVRENNELNEEMTVGNFASTSGSGHIFYKRYTPRNLNKNKPVVSIIITHGLVEYHGRHLLLPEFLQNHFKQQLVITWIDLLGHGKSGGPRAHVKDFRHFSQDLSILINMTQEKLSDFNTKTFLIGHSMGGLVTLDLLLHDGAQNMQIDGVVLSNPCIRVKQEVPRIYQKTMEGMGSYVSKLRLPSIYTGEDLTSDAKLAQDFDADPLIPKFTTVSLLLEILKTSKNIRSLSYFLNIPTLFLVGGLDELTCPETTILFAGGISPDIATILHYPQLRHELFNEIDRKKVFHDVSLWLAKTLATSEREIQC